MCVFLGSQTSQQMILVDACRWGYGVMDVGLGKQVYIETVVEIVYYSALSPFYFTVAETE